MFDAKRKRMSYPANINCMPLELALVATLASLVYDI